MHQTANFQLNQWEATDRILREDFNADNAQLDAALAVRNCQFYTTAYTGGELEGNTLTFPRTPLLVLVVGHRTSMLTLRGATRVYVNYDADKYNTATAVWSGNSLSWSGGASGYLAISGQPYTVFAILDADS